MSGPELIGGTSGESEQRIRDVFDAAAAAAPSLLFIDALDVIAAKRDSNQRGMDRRIIAQLFDSIDSITQLGRRQPEDANRQTDGAEEKSESNGLNKLVVLVVATNK